MVNLTAPFLLVTVINFASFIGSYQFSWIDCSLLLESCSRSESSKRSLSVELQQTQENPLRLTNPLIR